MASVTWSHRGATGAFAADELLRRFQVPERANEKDQKTMTPTPTYHQTQLPPIMITTDDARRLSLLADSNMTRFPRLAHFLAREIDRANVVPEQDDLAGVVRMGSWVTYREEANGRVREVKLVYPDEADIDLNRISVLSPVGAALIGLSVGQTIQFQTPIREKRSLTVIAVSTDATAKRREGAFAMGEPRPESASIATEDRQCAE